MGLGGQRLCSVYWAEGLLGEYNMEAITRRDCGDLENRERVSLELGNNLLQLSPNPANDILKLSWMQDNADRIIIIDIMGRKVTDLLINGVTELELSVSEMTAGIYRVHLLENEIILASKAVVIE